MSRLLKYRLSLMMFLEYVVPGCTVPILSLYLKNYLHFDHYQVGQILSIIAIAALFAPFAASHIADRYISSEHLLALCHICGGVSMILLARQTHFWPFVFFYFLYGVSFTPTFGLTNAVALHHVADAKRDFGGIRMWGTAGWVVIAWAFSFLWLKGGAVGPPAAGGRLPHCLYAAGFSSFVLAAYSFTLPRSNVRVEEPTSIMYWKALKVMARPGLLLLCMLTFASSMTHQIYYYGMSPFLSQIGFNNASIMPFMSLGQISEVVTLGFLGFCLARVSIKHAMILGLLAQVVRYALFAYGSSTVLVFLGVTLHGVCYAFYFTAAYIYVDNHSTADTRAGVQQIFTIMIAGFGTLAAYLAGGYIAQFFTAPDGGSVDFKMFWLVPAGLSLAVAVVLALLFKEEKPGPLVGDKTF